MKKTELTRYDLDRVYWLKRYQETLNYAEQNVSIAGVAEQRDSLKEEKTRYANEVSTLVAGVRDGERQKYETYKKWENIAKISKWVFLGCLIIYIPILIVGKHLPFHVGNAIALLWILAFLVSTPVALVSFLGRTWCARQYQQYTGNLDSQLNALGRAFTERCNHYYNAIDNLFLSSLSPAEAAKIRLDREQIEQNKQLLQTQRKLLREQQETRALQEQQLAIEQKREAEREAARRGLW